MQLLFTEDSCRSAFKIHERKQFLLIVCCTFVCELFSFIHYMVLHRRFYCEVFTTVVITMTVPDAGHDRTTTTTTTLNVVH